MEGTKIHLCKCFFLSTNTFDHISKNIVAQTSLQQVQKLKSHAACQHIWWAENKTWTGHMIAMSQGFNRISKCKINSLTNILLYLVYSNQCFASPVQTWQQISMHGRIVDLQRLSTMNEHRMNAAIYLKAAFAIETINHPNLTFK